MLLYRKVGISGVVDGNVLRRTVDAPDTWGVDMLVPENAT